MDLLVFANAKPTSQMPTLPMIRRLRHTGVFSRHENFGQSYQAFR